ncbi:MAG: PIN domain-containing protein [Flavobacteriales bacterium]
MSPRAIAALEKVAGQQLVLCDVVVAELLAGVRNRAEYNATHRELNKQFHILPFTMEVSQHFRGIMAQQARDLGVHFADQLIAATAMAHDCSLLTLNQKHFKGIKGLKLA